MAATWCGNRTMDLLRLLSRSNLLDISDLIRFSLVCKTWRSVLDERNWFGSPQLEALGLSPPHIPKLMLAETNNDRNKNFLDVATGLTFQLPLPEARNRRICGSGKGWVVTMGEDMEIHLLNPITRQQIRLPSQLSFNDFGDDVTNEDTHRLFKSRKEIRDTFIEKAIIIGNPNSAGDCMVAAIVLPGCFSRVVVVRPGLDRLWTVLTSYVYIINDIIPHKGLLYGLSYGNYLPQLHVWDMNNITNGFLQEMEMISMTMPIIPSTIHDDCLYLVEVFGELLSVSRIHSYSTGDGEDCTCYTSKVLVFKSENSEDGRWLSVNDLGDCCLVLGGNTSMALSPVPSGFKRNCIYFIDNHLDGYNYGSCEMVVYSLDDGQYRPLYHGHLIQTFSPPISVTFNPKKNMINIT